MSTIPATQIVNVQPNVLNAGGSALNLIGLILTTSTRLPIGSVVSFASPDSVGDYFGETSQEQRLATIYFAGFDGSNVKPGSVLFAQYNEVDVGAFLRGGNVSGLSVTQLQAINGPFAVTIDGNVESASINLSAATSFTSAAQLIQDTLGIEGPAGAAFTGSIATNVLTVASGLTGLLNVGDLVDGAGVAAGTYVLNQLTGPTGGLGTYTVSGSQTVSSESMTTTRAAITYDSILGAFTILSATDGASSTITFASGAAATALKMTQSTGAVISQGAVAATPAPFMDAVVSQTQNWATFMLAFNPDDPNTHTVKEAFAAWTSTTNNRYAYVSSDPDQAPAAQDPATSSLGYAIEQAQDSGTCLVWEPSQDKAAFTCGMAASIDFAQTGGRTTLKFRSQAGLVADVSDLQIAQNLGGNPATGDRGNGYNFYGAYATANQNFVFMANGFISGRFQWFDSYINQIWLNNAFQLALTTFLINTRSVPYNTAGRTQIEAACADVIQAGLNFGAYSAGVTLSANQIAQVNAAAGRDIAGTLSQRGWYLLVGDATPEVRQRRGTPPCTFFYVDGESVQYINLASVALQ